VAIRDRVTVVTKQGQAPALVVDTMGQRIELEYPTRSSPWLRAQILNQNGVPQREALWVAESEIVSIQVDTDRPATKKRSAM